MKLLAVVVTDDHFEQPQNYIHCQRAWTCDNHSKQQICLHIQFNTTNKFGLKHNGMMTIKLILHNTSEEWFQQCSQEQKHQICVYIAVQGDNFKGDRSH